MSQISPYQKLYRIPHSASALGCLVRQKIGRRIDVRFDLLGHFQVVTVVVK